MESIAARKRAEIAARALRQRYDVCKELGECYLDRGEPDNARAYFELAVRLRPEFAGGHAGLGRVALRRGEVDKARELFEAARQKEPKSAEAVAGLAAVAAERGDADEAMRLYAESLALDGEDLATLAAMSDVCLRAGAPERVAGLLEAYLQRHPGSPRALLYAARLQAVRGEAAAARATLIGLLALRPDDDQAAALLAEIDTGGPPPT